MLPELGLWLEINYNFINNQIFFFKKGWVTKTRWDTDKEILVSCAPQLDIPNSELLHRIWKYCIWIILSEFQVIYVYHQTRTF